MAKSQQTVMEIAGREVAITNPDKLFFPQAGYTRRKGTGTRKSTQPLRRSSS